MKIGNPDTFAVTTRPQLQIFYTIVVPHAVSVVDSLVFG